MRVRMLTTAAGPDGVLLAGSTVDLPDDQALSFLRGGYAEAVLTASAPQPTPEPEPVLEQAVEEKPERRKPKARTTRGHR